MKNWIIRIIRMIILFIIISCSQTSPYEHTEDFDVPLLKKNHILNSSGDFEALVKLNGEYFKQADKIGYKEGKGLCFLNVGNVNSTEGNYKRAQALLNKAGESLKQSENGFHRAKFYDSYADYYSHLKQYDKAIIYSDSALCSLKKAPDSKLKKELLPRIYTNRGTYFAWKGEFGTSLKSFRKGRDLENSAYSNCMLAQYYLYTQKLDSAGVYALRAGEMMNRQKTTDIEKQWVYYTLGYYYNQVNQYDEAEKMLNKVLEMSEKTKSIYSFHIREVYNALADVYKKKNDKEKAYFYLQKYLEEDNRLNEARFAAINKTTDDFILESKKESGQRENELWIIGILSAIILTVTGILIWKSIRHLESKKKSLKTETDTLKNQVHKKKLQEVIEMAKNNDSLFLMKFKELYPEFISRLLTINPDFENSELAFCALLKLHFSSKEIADYTFVQHKSIQQKKYRLRKKLNLEGDQDIYEFLDNLEKFTDEQN
ncbi:tetratricopeptide repeat protein [Chryseobacterium sp. L7]|uniref:Tetratricopeptide repeat protein n=1 Tax=Chryseobacterium endalhagicum TaxID=2797638 RepID=A0ABS1QIT3_9FLAO|nr:tetratricopeptide repeat protein [Chryseobacterium endalhagicum]MBL1222531.1 tetratricopeptide repeat protein [Chryseobacterium endalhagicum]